MSEASLIKSKERVQELGEVFTPRDLVDLMLNDLPSAVWLDPTTRWLEPSCGDGNFLFVILERLMGSLSSWEPDEAKLHRHIVENMLFGVDIMPDNVEACIDRLNASHLKHNIVCADGLTYDYRFGRDLIEPSGMITPAQKLYKKPGLNAWYVVTPEVPFDYKAKEPEVFDSGLFF